MDDGFQIPTPNFKAAISCAEHFLEWQMSNPELAGLFANHLVARLEECFQTTREKIRGKRNSSSWLLLTHLQRNGSSSWKVSTLHQLPFFFQFVTDSMMKSLVKERLVFSSRKKPTKKPGTSLCLRTPQQALRLWRVQWSSYVTWQVTSS